MWLFTREGFFNAARSQGGQMIVQARVRQDLENLRPLLGGEVAIVDTPAAEYGHEMVLTQAQWLALVGELAAGVDYDSLATVLPADPARRAVYLQCWAALRSLQVGSGGGSLDVRLVDVDSAEEDLAEEAFALLDGLRAAGGFDAGTAVVTLQFHLGLDEAAARGYLRDWLG